MQKTKDHKPQPAKRKPRRRSYTVQSLLATLRAERRLGVAELNRLLRELQFVRQDLADTDAAIAALRVG
jgi:hypothetical protein